VRSTTGGKRTVDGVVLEGRMSPEKGGGKTSKNMPATSYRGGDGSFIMRSRKEEKRGCLMGKKFLEGDKKRGKRSVPAFISEKVFLLGVGSTGRGGLLISRKQLFPSWLPKGEKE